MKETYLINKSKKIFDKRNENIIYSSCNNTNSFLKSNNISIEFPAYLNNYKNLLSTNDSFSNKIFSAKKEKKSSGVSYNDSLGYKQKKINIPFTEELFIEQEQPQDSNYLLEKYRVNRDKNLKSQLKRLQINSKKDINYYFDNDLKEVLIKEENLYKQNKNNENLSNMFEKYENSKKYPEISQIKRQIGLKNDEINDKINNSDNKEIFIQENDIVLHKKPEFLNENINSKFVNNTRLIIQLKNAKDEIAIKNSDITNFRKLITEKNMEIELNKNLIKKYRYDIENLLILLKKNNKNFEVNNTLNKSKPKSEINSSLFINSLLFSPKSKEANKGNNLNKKFVKLYMNDYHLDNRKNFRKISNNI